MTSPAHSIVAVGSGKGGVGKSTVSLNLALALRERGASVGLLDADFYGPDIPLMVNVTRTTPLKTWTFWQRGVRRHLEPLERFGLKIMSVGFLVAERQPLSWPAQMVELVGRQLVHDVAWGSLDYLLVDLPPGSADLQQQLLELLPLAGGIVVVTPQDVAHLDAKKVIAMLEDARVRVLGGIENMSALSCPHCGEEVDLFPRVRDERSIWSLGIANLGRIPLNPALAEAGDRGRPFLVARPDTPEAASFRAIAGTLADLLDGSHAR